MDTPLKEAAESSAERSVRRSREQFHRSIEAFRSDIAAEFGRAPGRSWVLPLTAAAVGLVAALALRRSLKRASDDYRG